MTKICDRIGHLEASTQVWIQTGANYVCNSSRHSMWINFLMKSEITITSAHFFLSAQPVFLKWDKSRGRKEERKRGKKKEREKEEEGRRGDRLLQSKAYFISFQSLQWILALGYFKYRLLLNFWYPHLENQTLLPHGILNLLIYIQSPRVFWDH